MTFEAGSRVAEVYFRKVWELHGHLLDPVNENFDGEDSHKTTDASLKTAN
jgi:hypothetical protein